MRFVELKVKCYTEDTDSPDLSSLGIFTTDDGKDYFWKKINFNAKLLEEEAFQIFTEEREFNDELEKVTVVKFFDNRSFYVKETEEEVMEKLK